MKSGRGRILSHGIVFMAETNSYWFSKQQNVCVGFAADQENHER